MTYVLWPATTLHSTQLFSPCTHMMGIMLSVAIWALHAKRMRTWQRGQTARMAKADGQRSGDPRLGAPRSRPPGPRRQASQPLLFARPTAPGGGGGGLHLVLTGEEREERDHLAAAPRKTLPRAPGVRADLREPDPLATSSESLRQQPRRRTAPAPSAQLPLFDSGLAQRCKSRRRKGARITAGSGQGDLVRSPWSLIAFRMQQINQGPNSEGKCGLHSRTGLSKNTT